MQKIAIVFWVIVGIVFANTANAVQKCVALNSSTTCSYVSTATGQSNWSSTCGGISIQGVAFCGSQSGIVGDTSDAVTTSGTSDDNKNCWCKMVSPAVSSWVFNFADTSAGACADDCAYDCAARAAASAGNCAASCALHCADSAASIPASGLRCSRPSAIDMG